VANTAAVDGVSELVLQVSDLGRAEVFYTETLGLPVVERWPHRESELPSWWAGTLWAYELVRGKPTAAAAEVVLYELRTAA